jgi:hypothetical protein
LPFETLERRIKRAMLNEQFVPGSLLNATGDPLTMLPPENKSLQDQKIERALKQCEPVVSHSGRHLTQD